MSASREDILAARLRASTIVTLAAVTGAAMLIYAFVGVQQQVLGDEAAGLWLYGVLLAAVAGVIGVPLALRNVEAAPKWQWVVEATLSAVAVVIAVGITALIL